MLVVDRVDDHAGAQEQKSLEKRVGEEVEHGSLPRTYTQREEHVTDLADRGIRQNALDIVLREGAKAGKQQGGRTYNCNDRLRGWSQGEENVRARYQIDARRYHRGCVDKRAGWRRTGHRIG